MGRFGLERARQQRRDGAVDIGALVQDRERVTTTESIRFSLPKEVRH